MFYNKNGKITIEQRRSSELTSMSLHDTTTSDNKVCNPFIVPMPLSANVVSSSGRRGSNDTVLSIIDAALSILESDDILDSGSTEQTRR